VKLTRKYVLNSLSAISTPGRLYLKTAQANLMLAKYPGLQSKSDETGIAPLQSHDQVIVLLNSICSSLISFAASLIDPVRGDSLPTGRSSRRNSVFLAPAIVQDEMSSWVLALKVNG